LQRSSGRASLARMTTLHDFTVPTIDGKSKSLADYRGKVLLVVNVASRCGLTPHYTGLEELYRAYKDRGFEVLGFPCNDFGAQEPGTEAEIKQFCESKYDVTFPLFSKLHVKGPEQAPLYKYLTTQPSAPDGPGDIGWNFAKFVIGKDGKIAARFAPTTQPASETITEAIEKALG
jgi:glutathione peroxidase